MHFEEFYRANLRFVPGARLRTLEVSDLYQTWATENGAPSFHLKQLRRFMAYIGHDAFNSCGMRYLDVGLAAAFPAIADNYPAVQLAAEARGSNLAGRIDDLITQLSGLRADVVHASEFSGRA